MRIVAVCALFAAFFAFVYFRFIQPDCTYHVWLEQRVNGHYERTRICFDPITDPDLLGGD